MDIKVTKGGIKNGRLTLFGEIFADMDPREFVAAKVKATNIMKSERITEFTAKMRDDGVPSEILGRIVEVFTDESAIEGDKVGIAVEVVMYVEGV